MPARLSTHCAVTFAALLAQLLAFPPALLAQDGSAAKAPESVTIGDPEIPLDHLTLLVKPLLRGELAAEAAAWRDLLKAKVQEMSDLQIGVKREKEKAEEAQQEEAVEVATAEANDTTQPAPEEEVAGAEAEQAEQRKAELAERIPILQEERAHLIDRLNVVVDAWEAKGGEVEEYRQYVTAVSGIEIDMTDTSTAWTAINGWIVSEQGGQRWMWNIIRFVATLAVFYLIARLLGAVTAHAANRIKGASELLKKFLVGFARQLVMVIGLIMAVSALEVNISPLLAAIGGAAFVIGLALQGTLSNFASGLIILGYRPFDVGDVIEGGGVSGIVDSMNLISTKIRTFDNKVMIVPNNKIATDTITNASASETRRVDLVFGIGYADDIEKAQDLLESTVKQHPAVLDDPEPTIRVNELGDSSVNFICRPWVKSADYWNVYWDLTRSVKETFDRHGISIPFPQRDVHVYREASLSES